MAEMYIPSKTEPPFPSACSLELHIRQAYPNKAHDCLDPWRGQKRVFLWLNGSIIPVQQKNNFQNRGFSPHRAVVRQESERWGRSSLSKCCLQKPVHVIFYLCNCTLQLWLLFKTWVFCPWSTTKGGPSQAQRAASKCLFSRQKWVWCS